MFGNRLESPDAPLASIDEPFPVGVGGRALVFHCGNRDSGSCASKLLEVSFIFEICSRSLLAERGKGCASCRVAGMMSYPTFDGDEVYSGADAIRHGLAP